MDNDITEIVETPIHTEDSVKVSHTGASVSDSLFKEQFMRSKVLDAREFTNLVKAVEKLVRRSEEYKSFIYAVHADLGLKSCAVLGKVGEDDDACSIEVDHYPFSLYDICASVINKYIETQTEFNTFMIARDVMKLHFDMKVGFVCLSKTVHELRHKGKIFISLSQVAGKFMDFAKEYAKYIEPEVVANLSKLVELTQAHTPLSNDPSFLAVRSQEYYDAASTPTLEDLHSETSD